MSSLASRLVDSHCHLDFPDFEEERDAVVQRAHDNGVGRMVTICTRVRRFERIREIAERYDSVWCTVGTHPHNAGEEEDVSEAELVALAANPRVVGIGESGLDYFYDKAPRAAQHKCFLTHMAACRATDLPLIVHTRDAEEDTLALLKEGGLGQGLRGLLHCFTSSRALAEAAVEGGFYISFSGILTFKKSVELRELARDLPLERILVETDSPYLAPMPFRGKRNEPAYVRHTASVLAEARGMSLDEITTATTANFDRLFTRAAA